MSIETSAGRYTAGRYVEAAAAPGAWWCPLRVPLDDYDTVCTQIRAAAHHLDTSITAAILGRGGAVPEVILLRDLSIKHGTVEIPAAAAVAARLRDVHDWVPRHREHPAEALVTLGLRRGYEPDAPVVAAADARALLARTAPGARSMSVRLFSVRVMSSRVRHEPGLLLDVEQVQLDGIGAAAAEFDQERWTVTSWCDNRTAALHLAL
ncbi:hypothetical protein [Amycolatopsis sp. NPDC059657]|uniref:hypothetical protein n=1 Tax=Amycolatopsis sp. NPDC059657 TaxID=3346899 RepID=UPI00366D32E9